MEAHSDLDLKNLNQEQKRCAEIVILAHLLGIVENSDLSKMADLGMRVIKIIWKRIEQDREDPLELI